jgi:hypothetical protein
MINLMEELEKLMKEKALPYGRKPISESYENSGCFQEAFILCSSKSIINISLYRNELDFNCFVLENGVWKNYQIGASIGRRIPHGKNVIDKPLSFLNQDEKILLELKLGYLGIIQYGDDLLKGDLEWTKESCYPPYCISEARVEEMYNAFKKNRA